MMQSKWMIKNGFSAGRKCLMLAALMLSSVFAVAESVPAVSQASSSTQEQSLSAYQVVDTITAQLLVLIDDAKQYVDEDEERFFTELDVLLRPFIDFRSFARAVMGRHASSKKMASLTEAERVQLNAQIDRFSEIFLSALIQTYGKGLLAFDGEEIEVVPPAANAKPQSKKVVVKQLIYGDRKTPYEVQYSMRMGSDGDWRLRNMVVESINLGKIYRNQFDNAFKVYEGDIDRVIDGWIVSGAPEAAAMNN
ncbi:MAG: ABC transporter substrate-binding protein [Cellvibrionales bacterium]|jgi:phospholipid transport system substrate-binding protein|nr:ABC transporter substrate-binding protein [Cellvibrionales bacterium]